MAHGGVRSAVGLDGHKGLFKSKQFHDTVLYITCPLPLEEVLCQ